jgi:cytochrome c556
VTGARHVVLAAWLVAMPCTVLAQEQGVTPPKDTIFARKILMGSIDMTMDEIETMTTSGGTLNLAEGQEHADIVSIMLMAFPHMFPASTNQWKPNADRDPATDTFASPDVWTNFADFYQRATAASKIAFEASRAKRASDFRALVLQLRTACNSCHAAYQKVD